MKLALVANSFPVVSETFIYNHAAGLQAAGGDVSVVVTSPVGDAAEFTPLGPLRYTGPIEHMLLSPKIPETLRHTVSRLRSLGSRDYELLKLAHQRYGRSRRALRAWLLALPLARFDVIHFEYSGIAARCVDALPLLAHARLLVSCRGTAERVRPIADAARAKILREVFDCADRVHCVSADMIRVCQAYGLQPEKAFVNHPAVDAERFRRATLPAISAGPCRLISTGRLHWAKGLEFALLAVRELVDRGVDVHYEIIGGGPDEERIRFAIHDLALAKHVTMSGRKPWNEVRASLQTADIYVLASVTEGVSNAALEAMAMELPVVSTSAGGMAEAIANGREGMLVRSRAPQEMAAALATLIADPERRFSLGRAARRRIERDFSLERQISKFIAEYDALMQDPRTRTSC